LAREPEATSALDTQTESQVTDAIASIGGGVTKNVVVHRFATMMHSDFTLFPRDGEVVGSGSFEELPVASRTSPAKQNSRDSPECRG
jgi:ABC-type bacteriocin/lantibiotic exporter with double-glycine peptidase domain